VNDHIASQAGNGAANSPETDKVLMRQISWNYKMLMTHLILIMM